MNRFSGGPAVSGPFGANLRRGGDASDQRRSHHGTRRLLLLCGQAQRFAPLVHRGAVVVVAHVGDVHPGMRHLIHGAVAEPYSDIRVRVGCDGSHQEDQTGTDRHCAHVLALPWSEDR